MSESHVNITFECLQCGGTVLKLPDDHTDDSIAKCKSCGVEVGRWGDIKSQAMKVAKSDINRTIKQSFKGVKGFKIK